MIGSIYFIDGTAEELADYQAKQGAQYRAENGQPLFFGSNGLQPGTPLHLSFDKTRYVIHTDLEQTAKVQDDKVSTLQALMAVTGYSREDLVKVALGGVASVKG